MNLPDVNIASLSSALLPERIEIYYMLSLMFLRVRKVQKVVAVVIKMYRRTFYRKTYQSDISP